jgi:hypothetical protein
LATRRFPAWFLGKWPKKQVICCSYGGDLATDFGRDVRNIVDSPEYQILFDTKLATDSKAANKWNTSEGGVYVAAGVNGPVTGRGADLGIIPDDPVKDRREAEALATQIGNQNWYTSTFYPRLMPGAALLLIRSWWINVRFSLAENQLSAKT